MLLRIVVTGLYMPAVFLGQYVFNFLDVPEPQMSTALLTPFVLFQLFNSFNCRELHRESIFTHLLKNKLMLSVVGCTFVLQVLIVQFAGAFFGTVPLDLALWLKLFGIASGVVVFSELIKWIGRMMRQTAPINWDIFRGIISLFTNGGTELPVHRLAGNQMKEESLCAVSRDG